ncbi:CpsD/CapB family tyrosine-protein kinase [Paenibacillus terrigena]|uniref:CpsD/CapB family tyrosine-protein kinase n=1 Tax=Paenibacillus terrigena TaxID=369333 RepID=UPI00036A8A45|nr:CpsD/CapB family tyrosine-protein kinase [Paenibacillus terrigena]
MSRLASETKLIMEINPNSPIAEAYRTLKLNIQFSEWDRKLQVIAVTSSIPGEGKTTTISNLAVCFAKEGKKVLIMDADLRKASLHRIFSMANKVGLSNVLVNQYHASDVIRTTGVDNLSILTSGSIPPNPAELLTSPNFMEMIDELKNSFDIILIDTPPILTVSDGLIVTTLCDGVVFVIQAGKAKRHLIKKSKEKLDYAKAPLLGVVLNNKKLNKSESQYYDYELKEE